MPSWGEPESPAQGIRYEEYETRAAFLLSLAKFTEWPEGAIPVGEPISLGVVGDSPMAPALEALGQGTLLGRKIVIRRFRNASEVQPCHILYFTSAEERFLPNLRAKLAAHGTLTVGETSFFLGYGGALHLFSEDGRLRFVLNRAALDQSRLRVAVQVQRLAKQVINQP
ncbi:MAG TPA: YfiR family protein [Holophagaceae bacterium]|nr:YfiR family protein [Holophagaceae bacterium]